jgi:hypothetical protein
MVSEDSPITDAALAMLPLLPLLLLLLMLLSPLLVRQGRIRLGQVDAVPMALVDGSQRLQHALGGRHERRPDADVNDLCMRRSREGRYNGRMV